MKLVSKISFFVAASCLLTLASCKKDPIVMPEGNDPVFTLNGTLGGEDLNLVAGDNNAYMYSSTELEYGVRVFSGELSDGSTSIELGIFDGNLDKPNHVPEVDLSNVILQYAKQSTEPFAILSKDSIINSTSHIESIEWVENGLTLTAEEPIITDAGKHDICARVKFVGDPEVYIYCNDVIVGFQRNANFSIKVFNELNNITATISPTITPINNIEWFLDDSLIDTTNIFTYPLDGGTHILKSAVEFENGVIREKSCLVGGQSNSHYVKDFTAIETQFANNVTQDYSIRLNIVKDGVEYRSTFADNENSTIDIISLEQYNDNANGNEVYKAVIQINAVVMEMTTEKLIPVHFVSTFGIEIP